MTLILPERMLSKSKLSTFLRTQCDRHLYLSLFKNNQPSLQAAKLPVPLKTRPAVQLITKSGQDFERDQFDKLIQAIPNHVVHDNNYSTSDLSKALSTLTAPAFILQPQIEPESYRDIALGNLGVKAEDNPLIPKMSDLRPDVLFVYQAIPGEYEILPDGSRKLILDGDKRSAISVIDLKNVTEANSSYAAEVCLYAFFFANWLSLQSQEIKNQYFVSDQIYLWKHVEMQNFNRILSLKEGADHGNRVNALIQDLQEGLVDYLIFMPSVKKFYSEDIPRVIKKGDGEGWEAVSYHVSPKCGSCDWLGNKAWLWGEDLKIFNISPEHYCLHSADISDHLSKMSGLSKGASQILTTGGHPKIADLVDIASSSPVLKRHALLKRDKSQIGAKAKALNTGVLTLDPTARIGGLAGSLNAEYDVIVNFDAGAGLLTGIAIRGILFPPYGQQFTAPDGSQTTFMSFHEEAFVNGKDFGDAEWVALHEFIRKFSFWACEAQRIFSENSWGSVHSQICFWEPRQYEALCNAFSRHLIKVLELPEREARALAWIFPAEQLMERDEYLAPGIVFIRDIIDLATRLPIKFADTLLGVAEVYHLSTMTPRKVDTYYREPLGNAIPRERIFEIWKSTTGLVKMYGQQVSLVEATKKYGDILKAHAWALASITARLRTDLKGRLESKAPALVLTIPSGAASVAYDSKLWIQWDKVEASTSETEHKASFITKAERLESSYKTILLTKFIQDLGNYTFEYEVSDDSSESKLEEGGIFYKLGVVSMPGLLLQTGYKLGIQSNPGVIEDYVLWMPLHRIIAVSLVQFDRVGKKAIIELRPTYGGVDGLFKELISAGHIPLFDEPVYIIDGLPPPSEVTKKILQLVANPTCAKISKESLLAMGTIRARAQKGADDVTPIARVLWEADLLAKKVIRTDAEARLISDYAKTTNSHALNPSQEQAVFESAKNQLSIIWGPPGTGKTDTLVSLLNSIVAEAQTINKTRKILITGPNYRAVEELANRLLDNLDNKEECKAKMFYAYSKTRPLNHPKETKTHLEAKAVSLNIQYPDADLVSLKESLNNPDEITIVATTAHAVNNLAELLYGKDNLVQKIFDLVVIDESSQVPVTLALRPLAVLKTDGQLIVAGDHLQMPPIASLEPPKDAEYLVGSIQTYFLTRFNKIATQDLLVNYRSNQDLVDFAKTLGYSPKLIAQNKERRLENIHDIDTVIDAIPDTLPKTQAYKEALYPERKVVALIHDDIVSSQANEIEAKLVAGLAFALRNSMSKNLFPIPDGETFEVFTDDEFFKFGIGVVTPHKAQKALVIRELMVLFPDASAELIFEAVDTVERFQGGERQTIIVSFGVGDLDIIEGEEAFLFQMERTNVAVSRAKAKCIMLMPKSLAYYLPADEKVIKASKAIKSYIEEFCPNRISIDIESADDKRLGEVRWH